MLNLQKPIDYVALIADGIVLKKNVVIARHADQIDRRLFKTSVKTDAIYRQAAAIKQTIDVWVTSDWENANTSSNTALMLQLAYVLYSNPLWRKRTSIRLLKLATSNDAGSLQRDRAQLSNLVEKLRVDSHVKDLVVVPVNTGASPMAAFGSPRHQGIGDSIVLAEVNLALQRQSRNTAQILLPLPNPKPFAGDELRAAEYLRQLDRLTVSLPSTLLVWKDDDAPSVISTGI